MKAAIEKLKKHLDSVAEQDKVFAEKYANESKSLEECMNYVKQEIYKKCMKNPSAMTTDEEVYGLAIHYYDEDDIKLDKNIPQARVMVTSPEAEVEVEETPQEEPMTEEKPKAKRGRKAKAKTEEQPKEVEEKVELKPLIIPILKSFSK